MYSLRRKMGFSIALLIAVLVVMLASVTGTTTATINVEPMSPSVVIVHTVQSDGVTHIPNCIVKIYDEDYTLVHTLDSGASGICEDIVLPDYKIFYVTARGKADDTYYFGSGHRATTGGVDNWYVKLYEQASIGGFWVSVDKFGLLAPYIGLVSTILVGTVATGIYVKRVKRREEKQ